MKPRGRWLEHAADQPCRPDRPAVADGEEQAFEATAEEESELLEAIAGVERGETVRAEDLLARLRR